jgi:hypothetical protein
MIGELNPRIRELNTRIIGLNTLLNGLNALIIGLKAGVIRLLTRIMGLNRDSMTEHILCSSALGVGRVLAKGSHKPRSKQVNRLQEVSAFVENFRTFSEY